MTTKYEKESINEETEEKIIPANDTIYSVGNIINETKVNELLNIRPVVYLKTRTLFTNGNGTFDNPYQLK